MSIHTQASFAWLLITFVNNFQYFLYICKSIISNKLDLKQETSFYYIKAKGPSIEMGTKVSCSRTYK